MAGAEHDILSRLPHRPPFLFVTRLVQITAGRQGRGVWSVTGKEEFLKGHFPDEPLVPGVLITEALAQLAGIVSFAGAMGEGDAHEHVAPDGRLVQVEMRYDRAVSPPAEIELFAKLVRRFGRLCQCEVRAEVAGDVAARGTLVIASAGKASISMREVT